MRPLLIRLLEVRLPPFMPTALSAHSPQSPHLHIQHPPSAAIRINSWKPIDLPFIIALVTCNSNPSHGHDAFKTRPLISCSRTAPSTSFDIQNHLRSGRAVERIRSREPVERAFHNVVRALQHMHARRCDNAATKLDTLHTSIDVNELHAEIEDTRK